MWWLVRLVELLKKDLLKKEPSAQQGRFERFLNPAAGDLRIPPLLSCQSGGGLHPLSTTRPSFILRAAPLDAQHHRHMTIKDFFHHQIFNSGLAAHVRITSCFDVLCV